MESLADDRDDGTLEDTSPEEIDVAEDLPPEVAEEPEGEFQRQDLMPADSIPEIVESLPEIDSHLPLNIQVAVALPAAMVAAGVIGPDSTERPSKTLTDAVTQCYGACGGDCEVEFEPNKLAGDALHGTQQDDLKEQGISILTLGFLVKFVMWYLRKRLK